MDINHISGQIVDAAIQVHRMLGPGLLESAYEACLKYELLKRGLKVESQLPLHIMYEGIKIEAGYKLDLLVEDCVIVELKAVEKMIPLYDAQLLSYLKLGDKRLGLRINFNVVKLVDGVKRIANNLPQ